MISMVLILTAVEQANGNAIAVSLGHDVAPGNTYSVPLSASGNAPATHYGCRTWASPGFALMIEIAKSGVVPNGTSPELAALSAQVVAQYPDTIAALIADRRDTAEPWLHWSDVLAAQGLIQLQDGPA